VTAWHGFEVERLEVSHSIYVLPGAGTEEQGLGSKRRYTVIHNACEGRATQQPIASIVL
jgi:hypothetical protein